MFECIEHTMLSFFVCFICCQAASALLFYGSLVTTGRRRQGYRRTLAFCGRANAPRARRAKQDCIETKGARRDSETVSCSAELIRDDAKRADPRAWGGWFGGNWQCAPVEIQFAELSADAPQIPDLKLLVPIQDEQLRTISREAQVRDEGGARSLQISQRFPIVGGDQTDDSRAYSYCQHPRVWTESHGCRL